jgi:hypothetical protein
MVCLFPSCSARYRVTSTCDGAPKIQEYSDIRHYPSKLAERAFNAYCYLEAAVAVVQCSIPSAS